MQVSFINHLALSDQNESWSGVALAWSDYVGSKLPDKGMTLDFFDSILAYMALMVVHTRPKICKHVSAELCFRLLEIYSILHVTIWPVLSC